MDVGVKWAKSKKTMVKKNEYNNIKMVTNFFRCSS